MFSESTIMPLNLRSMFIESIFFLEVFSQSNSLHHYDYNLTEVTYTYGRILTDSLSQFILLKFG